MKSCAEILAVLFIGLAVALGPARADAPTPDKNHPLKAEYPTTAAVFCVAYSPDGTRLAGAGKDNTIKIWDTATGQGVLALIGHSNAVMSVSWSPDGATLASASLDGTVKLWDAATGQCKSTLSGHTDFVWSVSFSPNGRTLASGSSDKTVKLWDVTSGQCTATLGGHTGTVNSVAWSPDGRTLASASADNTIKLWDVTKGANTATLTGHLDEVTSVSFSPDGTQLVSGSRDNTIKLWNVATGQCTATLTGHTEPVYRVSWSPDGTMLASGSVDKTVKLWVWNLLSDPCIATLTGHSAAVSSVCWSPDGTTLASGSRDNSIKVWSMKAPVASGVTPAPSVTPGAAPASGIPASAGSAPQGGPIYVGTGAGKTARFSNPRGIAVDGKGNVYVADAVTCTIRKITPDGVVTTLAGSAGKSGGDDGVGSEAKFYNLGGLASDSKGNLYVVDNACIRRITPEGAVTTLAGKFEKPGSTDGTGGAARFRGGLDVAVDGKDNIYVADSGNLTLRKITPEGVVTTLAGSAGMKGTADGTGSAARFSGPHLITVDGSGNIYVVDGLNDIIRKITAEGVVTTPGISVLKATGLVVDGGGNFYFGVMAPHNVIEKIAPDGDVTIVAGKEQCSGSRDGPGAEARFNNPSHVALDAAGNLYVADDHNNLIRKITPDGMVRTLAGATNCGSCDGTGSAARFNYPNGVAVDAGGNVYVADTQNDTIRKITPQGVVTTLAGSAGEQDNIDGTGSAARFNRPSGIAVDSSGNVYVGGRVQCNSPQDHTRRAGHDFGGQRRRRRQQRRHWQCRPVHSSFRTGGGRQWQHLRGGR